MKDDDSKLKFGAAMEELEGILSRVESEEIDIDELAEELKRAAQLLELCRAKIRRAEVEVSQVVQTLEEPTAEPAAEPDEDSDGEPGGVSGEATSVDEDAAQEPSAKQGAAGTGNLFEHDA